MRRYRRTLAWEVNCVRQSFAARSPDRMYRIGFAKGEEMAAKDRKSGATRPMPDASTPYGRGYVDGYTPRSSAWPVFRSPEYGRVQSLGWQAVKDSATRGEA